MNGDARAVSPAPDQLRRLRALVVFESLIGDTYEIARAVADGLDGDFDSEVLDIRDVAPTEAMDYDLIVTGEPSLMFGIGVDRTEDVDDGAAPEVEGEGEIVHLGLKDWLAKLPQAHERQFCACFDTRAADSCCGEAASIATVRTLHALGYVVLSRQTFVAASIGGPLRGGELRRAREWAASLAARIP